MKKTLPLSAAQAASAGHRSRPASRSAGAALPSSGTSTRVMSPGSRTVSCPDRTASTNRPSGEIRGLLKSASGAVSRVRRVPVRVSMTATSSRRSPQASYTDQPVTAYRPSGVSSK